MTVDHLKIKNAWDRLKGQVIETPTVLSPFFSEVVDGHVYLKLETLQATASFKDRGAFVKLSGLTDTEKKSGIIAVSAGNHAQSVAFHARKLGIPATIIMPIHTPATKVRNTEKWGAHVILKGETLDESSALAHEMSKENQWVFIHPYDDEDIIAGQGTVALEMLEDHPDIENIVIPIGGGGLAAGMAIAAKAHNPKIRIYGAEVQSYASMSSILNHKSDQTFGGPTLAEGIAVKSPGGITSPILKEHLEDIILVSESDIERAVDLLARKQKLIAEGAGAAGIAALLHSPDLFHGQKTGVVICGGNIDPRIFASIVMHGQMREGYITHLRITLHDVPGALAKLTDIVAKYNASIIELTHQRLFHHRPVKMADVDVMIETCHAHDTDHIIEDLEKIGYDPVILDPQAISR